MQKLKIALYRREFSEKKDGPTKNESLDDEPQGPHPPRNTLKCNLKIVEGLLHKTARYALNTVFP